MHGVLPRPSLFARLVEDAFAPIDRQHLLAVIESGFGDLPFNKVIKTIMVDAAMKEACALEPPTSTAHRHTSRFAIAALCGSAASSATPRSPPPPN